MSFAFKKFRFFGTAEVPGHAWPQHATCNAPSRACMAVGCENGSIQVCLRTCALLLVAPLEMLAKFKQARAPQSLHVST